MNTYQTNRAATTGSNRLGTVDKSVRTIVGFGSLLAILAGVATAPLQYFVLSCLGIYLIHTVIIGLDPFYAAARTLRSALARDYGNHLPVSSAGAR